MEKYLKVIESSALFDGIATEETVAVLGCLLSVTCEYSKNQFILHFGDCADSMGLVLSGSVHIVKEDFWGNRNIVAKVAPGQLFAEAYACTPGVKLAVSVVAAEQCTIMFLDIRRVLTLCSTACTFHTRLVRNLLSVMAAKNLLLNDKLTHMSQRTTREKLLSYLSAEAMRLNSPSFEVPFNRQQLADYLSVDRSAMSNELCKMRDEGLLSFAKNAFTLH